MKTVLFFFLLGLSGFATRPEGGVLVHHLIVQPSSSLTIDGKTNMGPFRCGIARYVGKDTLVLLEGGRNRKPYFKKGYVGLEAARFDCGMQLMTNDFRKAIKSAEYPVISISFISFERRLQFNSGKNIFRGRMQISLAGVTRTFDIDCTIEVEEPGVVHFKGGRHFTFSDFNLEPPTRMMGLVKVDGSLDVNFHLVLLLDKDA